VEKWWETKKKGGSVNHQNKSVDLLFENEKVSALDTALMEKSILCQG
jgi:hypothetical protein